LITAEESSDGRSVGTKRFLPASKVLSMLIVGLQCGHDASVAVVMNGQVLVHLEQERVTRIRHDEVIAVDLIHQALGYCGLAAKDVDLFALCTTQRFGYQSDDASRLSFSYSWETAEALGADKFRRTVFDRAVEISKNIENRNIRKNGHYLYNSEWPDMADVWTTKRGMLLIDELKESIINDIFTTPSLAAGHVLPMTVTLDGKVYPAVGVMHQLSHAAAAFYQSSFETAAVFAQDVGNPIRSRNKYTGGMLFHGEGHRLIPIWTAPVAAGLIYNRCAELLELGGAGGPGKLMGLSAYGEPVFFDSRFIGDVEPLADLYLNPQRDPDFTYAYGWFDVVDRKARQLGYAVDGPAFGSFGKDLAASAQKTFEALVLFVVERLRVLLTRAGRMGPNLCLSGGCALNCPTNSRIVEETEFTSVFVPPSCDDGGLSIGASLYAYHHVLGHDRREAADPAHSIAALGRGISTKSITQAVKAAATEFEIEPGVDLAERAAADLASDNVVALFQGRAESGPRALGHRSLLADPRRTENWARVNGLKSRELWRPFAPACLSEKLRDHFDGGPPHSPHMLFNYRVRSQSLGAVTHVDGSARVQTVHPASGAFRDIIEAFDRRTGTPVVMNTSLNGPGEPIVETPEHALNFLRRTGTDVLYLENNRIRKRSA
jgi:carbamoyltransferase